MSRKLLLFDLDGTLIDTGGAGLNALADTARELFGDTGPPLQLSGATDSGILRKYCDHFEVKYDDDLAAKFFSGYLPRLKENLRNPAFGGRLLTGGSSLLAELSKQGHQLAMLTGNVARGAWIKTDHYGLSSHFTFGAFGDDHWDRNKLGPIALQRAEEKTGQQFAPESTFVIGDTPKDIACAHAFGAIAIAVTTGNFNSEELKQAGADQIVDDLSELSI